MAISVPRIDGLLKVLGEKVYARDLRAHDMPGWPRETAHALIVRAGVADRPVGIDLAVVEGLPIQPLKTVTAVEIEALKIRPAAARNSFGSFWFVPEGSIPEHIAQPVAMLIFETPSALRAANDWLNSGKTVLRYGSPPKPSREQDVRRLLDPLIGVRQRDPDATYLLDGKPKIISTHYVRIAGTSDDIFSHVQNGPHDPNAVGPDVAAPAISVNLHALESRNLLERTVAEAGWTVIDRNFSTQSTDPMFMEPEAGIAWWDRDGKELHLVVGTQSPHDDREDAKFVFNQEGCPLKGVGIRLHARYPGGGFGGRDKSSFPLYLALAAAFAKGPVRLSFDRFEQFLCGIKRHACAIQARLAFDDTGTLQAFQSSFHLDGGGEANLTAAVVGLSALHAAGPYRIPMTAISARGIHTTSAPSGSMRGFGIPQAAFAIESLMDEAAERVGVDPIDFRSSHVLKVGDKDVTGMTLDHHLANDQLCDMARQEPLWMNRNSEKGKRDRAGLTAYGVGFATCMEAYGTSSDATLCEVILEKDGSITLHSSCVDAGQGSATSIAIATTEVLGRAAANISMGETEAFEFLGMKVGKPGDEPSNPKVTPKLVNSSSASVTAFHHLHAVNQASRVLFDHGVRPAAELIWGAKPAESQWMDGSLTAEGHPPLTLTDIAKKAYETGNVVSAMVHTFFQHSFATSTFEIGGVRATYEIDALAVTYGGDPIRTLLARESAVFPSDNVKNFRRTLYASAGHLVAVEIHLPTGRLKVLDAVTFLDAGDVHHEALLRGQVEGGFAMGLGYALLEELPPAPEGVNGEWNLNRYQVPRIGHMPLDSLELRLIPLTADSIVNGSTPVRKKGIAEATMTTVAPAVANAVAHAIGSRINSLPITPAKILEALRVI